MVTRDKKIEKLEKELKEVEQLEQKLIRKKIRLSLERKGIWDNLSEEVRIALIGTDANGERRIERRTFNV